MLSQSGWTTPARRVSTEPWLLMAVLSLWWCVAVGSTLSKSATSDEFFHMVGGASYWLLNDYRLQPENGNLPQRWVGLPLVLAGWPLPAFDHPGWTTSRMGDLARAYLFEIGNPGRSMLLLARSFAAVWGVLVSLLVYRWSRELFGPAGAWLSLAFCLTDTTLLANAPLATSDTCAAFFFTWSTLAIWRMLQLPSTGTVTLAALAVSGLFVAKFSALLQVVVGVVLLAIRWRYGPDWEVRWRGRRHRVSAATGLAAVAACVLVIAALVWCFIWASFGFRYAAMNPATAPAGSLQTWGSLDAATAALGGSKGRWLAWLGGQRLLPEGYLYGMSHVFIMMLRQSFLCGEYSLDGWLSYFPFTFLVKTPLPTLVGLCALAYLSFGRTRAFRAASRARTWYPYAPLLTLLAVYWAVSVTSTLNIGHRHLLPIYPTLFVLLGALPSLAREQVGLRTLPSALAAWAVFTCLWAFPHYLAFFNGIVGRDEAWHYLVDSNLDWGQEHYTLEEFVKAERRRVGRERRIYGCLFDSTPQPTGDAAVTLLPTAFNAANLPPLEPGTYCISVTHLQGIYLQPWGPWTARREERFQDRVRALQLFTAMPPEERQKQYGISPDFFVRIVEDFHKLQYIRLLAQLRERSPDVVLNGAILVYRLDEPLLDTLLRGEPPAQAARFPGSEWDD